MMKLRPREGQSLSLRHWIAELGLERRLLTPSLVLGTCLSPARPGVRTGVACCEHDASSLAIRQKLPEGPFGFVRQRMATKLGEAQLAFPPNIIEM